MAFKLGSEKRGFKSSSSVKVVKTPLESDTIAEARNDGSIAINSKRNVTGDVLNRAIKHEMKHMCDMEEGRADYGENWVMWEGKLYFRKHINGEDVIDGPNGRWPEGDKNHPWEQEAIQAEKSPLKNYKKGYYGIK